MPDHVQERKLAAVDDALAGRAVPHDLAELGELARALRDERPAIPDSFAHVLDARAERGFPGRTRARARPSHPAAGVDADRTGVAVSVTVLVIAVVAATVPGGGGGDFADDGGGAASRETAGEEAAPEIDAGPDASVLGPTRRPAPPSRSRPRACRRPSRRRARAPTGATAARSSARLSWSSPPARATSTA